MEISGLPGWDEIELAERYLICCMLKEALDVSSSILKRLRKSYTHSTMDEIELYDMSNSAGMVFVQSLKQLKRTCRIFDELAALFPYIGAIPVQTLLLGVCFQISEGCVSGLEFTLKEYISSWKRSPDQLLYVHVVDKLNGQPAPYPLSVDEYIQVSEVYAVSLLGTALGSTDLAASWIEAAEIPDAKRQELMDKLRAVISLKACVSSRILESEESNALSTAVKASIGWQSLPEPSVLKLSTMKIKFTQFMASKGRLLFWASLTLFVLNILRKKGHILKGILAGQLLYIRKALLDFWRLAFSVQVNPLAAVQPLPRASS